MRNPAERSDPLFSVLRQAGAIRAAGAIDIIPGVIGRKPAWSVPINQYASRSDGAKRLLPMSRDRVEGRGNPARSGIETFSSERAVVQAPESVEAATRAGNAHLAGALAVGTSTR